MDKGKCIYLYAAGLVIILFGTLFWICLWYQTDISPRTISIASGVESGEYYNFVNELKKRLESEKGRQVKNKKTVGTFENLSLLKEKAVHLALLQSIFFPHDKISVIAPLYLEPIVILARKDSDISSIYDLENKQVCTGPKASGTAQTSDTLIDFYGLNNIKRKHIFFQNDGKQNTRQECKVGILVMGLNSPCLKKINSTSMLKVLDLPYTKSLANSQTSFTEFTLPEGTFARHPLLPAFPDKDIHTVAYTALLAAQKEISPTLVHDVLEAIYSTDLRVHFPDLIPLEKARNWLNMPLHTTTQEYYNPLQIMESFANRMESYAAIKELLFAFFAASYFFWLHFNRIRKKKEQALVQEMKDKLDEFVQVTMALDRKQMQTTSPIELQHIIDQITELKMQALEDLTDEKLRSNQMFSIFLMQCHNVTSKIQTKILIMQ